MSRPEWQRKLLLLENSRSSQSSAEPTASSDRGPAPRTPDPSPRLGQQSLQASADLQAKTDRHGGGPPRGCKSRHEGGGLRRREGNLSRSSIPPIFGTLDILDTVLDTFNGRELKKL
ncbi:hypothetical protein AXG93_3818s1410 [Marchantia polymorpha subsp. ruderalis]|uniref:Uncharacterized protein n=1 Tax=Marchantia polymorpha subsp. ruderalis TaxID=1480154 RepID=A0A176VIA9_MARPO|nr:hypothetical protein AXG93_3818s1410 [Marchantia polymorpha subsp. ruderalis]